MFLEREETVSIEANLLAAAVRTRAETVVAVNVGHVQKE